MKEFNEHGLQRQLELPDNMPQMNRRMSRRRTTKRGATVKRVTMVQEPVVEMVEEEEKNAEDDDDPFTSRFGAMAFNVKNH